MNRYCCDGQCEQGRYCPKETDKTQDEDVGAFCVFFLVAVAVVLIALLVRWM